MITVAEIVALIQRKQRLFEPNEAAFNALGQLLIEIATDGNQAATGVSAAAVGAQRNDPDPRIAASLPDERTLQQEEKATSKQPEAPSALDLAWLIERYDGSDLMYWTGRKGETFSPSVGWAVKFADFESAEQVRLHVLTHGDYCRSVQHGFVAPVLPPLRARAEEQDVVCQHGTAMDVHCCNCHSGFIFDAEHECPPTENLKQQIREAAMLGLSYGAGLDVGRKEAALREIYALVDPPLGSPGHPVRRQTEIQDSGAGLIGPAIPDVAGTETRPIRNQIICAAIKLADGTIIRGQRHDGCFKYAEQMNIRTPERFKGHVQGFMDARNQFVDRKEAMRIQLAAGIPTADPRGRGGYHEGNGLFSEDLY